MKLKTILPKGNSNSGAISGVDYAAEWDNYADGWSADGDSVQHIGDEWIGANAGAATTREEYEKLITDLLIDPYITSDDAVMEIGIGGGKTSALLLEYCASLLCTDVSQKMLDATRARFKDDKRVDYVKLNGFDFSGIEANSLDVCFCFDTMVHMEPRDIFNYVMQIPALLKGKRLCVFHHSNVLSDLGFRYFLTEYSGNISGQRSSWPFSVMTDSIMQRFLDHAGYEVIKKDLNSIPRDCVWVCKAPEA